MDSLTITQYLLIALIFVWSGFVRSGLGFGGVVLALPLLLLIVRDPLVFLPIIALHLIIFSFFIMRKSQIKQKNIQNNAEIKTARIGSINWGYLIYALKIMIIPYIIGLLGLLNFPPKITSIFIFVIVLIYACGYVINRPIVMKNKFVEALFLAMGGYVSGSSLAGAPLIIPVFATNVPKEQLRDSLFVIWVTVTSIKFASFVVYGINLQLIHQLWLFPCALIGHILGEYFHNKLVLAETKTFFRVIGSGLIVVSLIGLGQLF